MSEFELVVLGTASQVPTRERAHHGALLRFNGHGILLDPGEGTQRQMTLAGVASSAVTRVCITHAHGDHCLGLPGVLQRCSLDEVAHPIDLHFPEAASETISHLRNATPYHDTTLVRLHPAVPDTVVDVPGLRIRAAELSHGLPTLGWRFEEPEGRTLLPERLAAAGVHGPARSELQRTGRVRVGGRSVELEEVSLPRPARSAALVMDTRWCEGALELAAGVDLLLVEATFLASERGLAEAAGHLTAGNAARLAREAGARRTVLTHFSRRYPTTDGHRAEASAAAPGTDLVVAEDLTRIAFPDRRPVA